MWLILDEAHITNLAVHHDYRQRGAGRAIMQELIRHAAYSGIARLTLEVRPSNQAARHLYATLGFKEEGRRRGYYLDTNEDAIIMWKNFWEE
jgi:ribosomal-protein-alanine N-acetyltransferase